MDVGAVLKAALELGVIPALALFLVISIHRQNRQLTAMIAEREKQNLEMIKALVSEIVQFRRSGNTRELK
jgi:hypothetical protein